jgi:hypothetical protein
MSVVLLLLYRLGEPAAGTQSCGNVTMLTWAKSQIMKQSRAERIGTGAYLVDIFVRGYTHLYDFPLVL